MRVRAADWSALPPTYVLARRVCVLCVCVVVVVQPLFELDKAGDKGRGPSVGGGWCVPLHRHCRSLLLPARASSMLHGALLCSRMDGCLMRVFVRFFARGVLATGRFRPEGGRSHILKRVFFDHLFCLFFLFTRTPWARRVRPLRQTAVSR